jgi:ribulose-bisphosphate carboxylase large chain
MPQANFAGVARHELTGKYGEKTSFDLRYFELEPGGYSSREKHVHEHVIIAARGVGVLEREGESQPLRQHDVAHIGPMVVHQLRNESNEPFGFYCIVDHLRDRPIKV